MTLHLEIITPERIAFSEDVDMVVAPGKMGVLGVLPRHEPLFAQLVEGELKIKKKGEDLYLAIGGGFMEITREKVTVLVTRAVHAKELNEAEIARAKKEAEEALKNKPTGRELVQAQALLRQSLVDMQLLRRRKHRIH